MASQSLVLLRRNFPLIALICLALLGLLAVIAAIPILITVLRVILGLAFVLFLPGFTLQAAVFPHRTDLDTPERLALSFGLSLAVIPLVALLLDRLPWGIHPWPILVAEGLLVLLFSLAAVLRSRRLPHEGRLQAGKWPHLPGWWSSLERGERRQYTILAGTLLTALLSASAILFLPSPAGSYTEFYILGAQGLAEGYAREARLGEDLAVLMGITNHERQAKTYRVEVWAVNPQGRREHLLTDGWYRLAQGVTREWPVSWQMPWPGDDQLVELLLFEGEQSTPYRGLRLWLDVLP